jgi:hypothetical protein
VTPTWGPQQTEAAGPEVLRLYGTRDVREAFDLVILGDGFDASPKDSAALVGRATAYTERLLGLGPAPGIAPFNEPAVRDLINIHLVVTPSKDSGITACPAARCYEVSETALGVRGNFNGNGPTDFDTEDRAAIVRAAAAAGDPNYLDGFLVILNCPEYGGRGFREHTLAYVSRVANVATFVRLATHELAHAIADLGDEYESCDVEHEVPRSFCNIATPKQLPSDVWWSKLARPNELAPDQLTLAARTECRDSSEPSYAAGTLGLFWGTMFVAAPHAPCACENDRCSLQRGDLCHLYEGYYRPQSNCLMRAVEHREGFCRVCAHVLRRTIEESARGPRLSTDPRRPLADRCFVP